MSNYLCCAECGSTFPEAIEGIDVVFHCPNCGSDKIGLIT